MKTNSGSIFVAMQAVLEELIEGEKSHSEILDVWDKLRGSDKFDNYVLKGEIINLIEESRHN